MILVIMKHIDVLMCNKGGSGADYHKGWETGKRQETKLQTHKEQHLKK